MNLVFWKRLVGVTSANLSLLVVNISLLIQWLVIITRYFRQMPSLHFSILAGMQFSLCIKIA